MGSYDPSSAPKWKDTGVATPGHGNIQVDQYGHRAEVYKNPNDISGATHIHYLNGPSYTERTVGGITVATDSQGNHYEKHDDHYFGSHGPVNLANPPKDKASKPFVHRPPYEGSPLSPEVAEDIDRSLLRRDVFLLIVFSLVLGLAVTAAIVATSVSGMSVLLIEAVLFVIVFFIVWVVLKIEDAVEGNDADSPYRGAYFFLEVVAAPTLLTATCYGLYCLSVLINRSLGPSWLPLIAVFWSAILLLGDGGGFLFFLKGSGVRFTRFPKKTFIALMIIALFGVLVACTFSMTGLGGLTFSYWGAPTKG